MSEPLSSLNQQIEQRRREIDRRLVELGFSMPLRSKVDSGYTGGNPATKRPGESAAATDETHLVLQSYGWNNPRASDDVIEHPVGGGKAVSKLASLPAGKLTTGGWWMAPTPYPTTETTLTMSSTAALRIFCPIPLIITAIIFEVTTSVGGSSVTVNLYSGDGTQLVCTATQTSASNARKTATPAAPVPISPGMYVVEVTSTDAGVALRATALSANGAAFLNEGLNTRATGHAMSSPANTAAFPWVKFIEA